MYASYPYNPYCCQIKESRYNTYKLISYSDVLIVSLDEAKKHLRLPAGATEDSKLTSIIKSVAFIAESITNRIFINKTFLTYRDYFTNSIELKQSPLFSITRFQYLKSNVLTTVPADLYYVTNESEYSRILLKKDSEYPTDIDERAQSIEIEFIAGYGATAATIYPDLHEAFLNHVAALYENRGDCDSDEMLLAKANEVIPANTRTVYIKYKISNIY